MLNKRNPDAAAIYDCPICQQGRQMVRCEISTGKLYLRCEECDSVWDEPETANTSELVAPDDKYGASRFVMVDELRDHPWFSFISNKGI